MISYCLRDRTVIKFLQFQAENLKKRQNQKPKPSTQKQPNTHHHNNSKIKAPLCVLQKAPSVEPKPNNATFQQSLTANG